MMEHSFESCQTDPFGLSVQSIRIRDSKEISFGFYNGLEVKDPKGRGSLRITASDQPDFTVTLALTV